jgi:6,7-dimethyl-8-ribityllumazine synthase
MTSGPDIGKYDPFEDTGDWPYRDAPPKHEAESAFTPAPEPDELTPEDALVPQVAPVAEPDAAVVPDEIAPAVTAEPEDVVPQEEVAADDEAVAEPDVESDDHAPGTLVVPPGTDVLSGAPHGFRRIVAVVVSRFNGDITTGLLENALAALRECNVAEDAVTVVPVPGAFELPLTALALAKTRRFSCVVALGCVIRGETAHFDLVASEAASGLQLAAIETGIPVAFGVITCETREQALARMDRGAEAARTALEMADLFSHVRTRAAAAG